MSKKFMVLMLVVFGVLLYLTSYALHKQTEPPPPPTPEEKTAQATQAKEAADKDMAERKKAMEEQRKRELANTGTTGLTKAQADNIVKHPNMPLPPEHTKKTTERDPNTMDITGDWMHRHADGADGISQEIAERQKHAKPVLQPKLQVPEGTAPIEPGKK